MIEVTKSRSSLTTAKLRPKKHKSLFGGPRKLRFGVPFS